MAVIPRTGVTSPCITNMRRLIQHIKAGMFVATVSVGAPANADTCIAYLKYTEGIWQVWIMDKNGGKQKAITRSRYDKSRLSWYPDGRSLLVNGNQGFLYQLDVKTGEENVLDIGMKGMFDAAISPDGESVSFGLSTSGSRDDHNVWRVSLDNNKAHKLTNLEYMQHLPTWSADGQWIYFSSKTDDQHNDIMRVSHDGKTTESITVNALYNFDAVESINKDIALSSNRTGHYEIWKIDAKGKQHQLTHRSARDARPNWSPDGQQIVFESSAGGQMNIWKMRADGSELKQITHDEAGARHPVWGPLTQKGICD